MMRSREFTPSAPLQPYVRLIWLLEIDEPVITAPPERVTPDGLVELVFHYRTPVACRYDGESFEPQPRSVAVSQTRRFLEFQPAGRTGLISVRFQPWGAYQFLDTPVAEFSDRQYPCAALWGVEALEVEERLMEAGDDSTRVEIVEQFLHKQLAKHHKLSVEPLVRTIWRQKGQITVSRLCRDLGVGERSLQRLFANALGTSPKRFARLSKFLHACRLLRQDACESGAQVGLDCGYYDQSHFIAEFRAFSGMTPSQFRTAQNLSFLEMD